ncbi:MAG: ketopantoate reductase family protein [Ignavibacteriales bacterium]
MRIAVVGAGVVGGYFGGHLAHAGEDIVFVERGRTLQALREHGLQVESVDGNFIVRSAQATDNPKSVGAVDMVLLAVKGWQVLGAIETIRPLMGPDTFVVPLMDGVEAPDQLAAAFGKERVAGGLAVMLGRAVAPSHIRNTLPQTSISIGELDGRSSARIVRLQKAFERAGVAAKIATDILSARWEKLILVGPWSAVGAVTRAPLGVVLNIPESRQLLEGAMYEVLAVARAHGARVSDDTVKQSLAYLNQAPAAAIGNLRDIIEGRPSELETEIGAIVRLAKAVGIEVPRHVFLYASLLPQERKARGEIEFPAAEEKSAKAA